MTRDIPILYCCVGLVTVIVRLTDGNRRVRLWVSKRSWNVAVIGSSWFYGGWLYAKTTTYVDKDLAEFTKYLLTIGLVVEDKDI